MIIHALKELDQFVDEAKRFLVRADKPPNPSVAAVDSRPLVPIIAALIVADALRGVEKSIDELCRLTGEETGQYKV